MKYKDGDKFIIEIDQTEGENVIQIAPCPVCGHKVMVSAAIGVGLVHCLGDGCCYRVGTIEEHNELCRKVNKG